MLPMRSLSRAAAAIFSAAAVIGIVYFINYYQIYSFMSVKKVSFIAPDNKKISANLFLADNPKGWLLLTHIMPETKESWNKFASDLQKSGYESLAIDLRGHGGSEGGPGGYAEFSKEEHQAAINDLEAGWQYLKSRGALPEKSTAIGGSIGANLSLLFLTRHPDVGGGVLLSAGNYQGIDSAELVKRLAANQKLLLVASKLDERTAGNNAEQNREYYNLSSQVLNRHLIIFDGAGHGTSLFELKEEYDLERAVIKFLESGRIN